MHFDVFKSCLVSTSICPIVHSYTSKGLFSPLRQTYEAYGQETVSVGVLPMRTKLWLRVVMARLSCRGATIKDGPPQQFAGSPDVKSEIRRPSSITVDLNPMKFNRRASALSGALSLTRHHIHHRHHPARRLHQRTHESTAFDSESTIEPGYGPTS